MEKVDERWFKNHGWTLSTNNKESKKSGSYPGCTDTRKEIRYVKYSKDGNSWASWYHMTNTTRDNNTGEKWHSSNYYMFYAHDRKTKFTVESRISNRKYTVDQIESALKLTNNV